MVLATHIIFAAYGFWLPNDPRGSWSNFVAKWELLLAGGKATKLTTRKSVAHEPHDQSARRRPKRTLAYPPVIFNGRQALSIATGIKHAIAESGYVVYACSIMPDHVHAVVARHQYEARRIAGHWKARATQQLIADALHPFSARADGTHATPWARECWRVFLEDRRDLVRAIQYVEENPVKDGKKRQRWPFVTSYRGDN